MWNEITVGQFQLLSRLKDGKNANVKLIGILNDMTEAEVIRQPQKWIIKEGLKLGFLNTEPELKEVGDITVNGRRYTVDYDIRHAPCARYIEIKHFGADVYENMHRMAASMVRPSWEKYDGVKHEQYSSDMIDAPFIEVYGSLVKLLNEMSKLDQSFPTLWEGGGDEPRGKSNFPKIYGWHFQVKQVADYENITLAEAWDLPTIQFLNDVSYLTAYADWQRNTN